jgi:hypothetical protein
MPARTFRDVWGLVALHVPGAPVTLVQDWVQSAYDRLWGSRHWAWLRTETLLTTLASRDVVVATVVGSVTVTSVGLFVSTDAGRQLRVGSGQIYTIDSYTDASTVVLTEAYQGTGGAETATISDIYLPMPDDFRSVHTLTDLSLQRPIAWWISRDRLDLYDAGRTRSDSRFRVLAAYQMAADATYAGRMLYEAWPHPTAAGTYRLTYFRRGDTLDDDTEFGGVLATKTTALKTGALAQAAAWPGTVAQRNPYFDLRLAAVLKAEFEQECLQLGVLDDDQYLMDLQQIDLARFGLAALSADSSQLRQTDAGIGDYY